MNWPRSRLVAVFYFLLAAPVTLVVLSALMFGVSVRDPATYAGVSLLLVVISFFACLVPAFRAARVIIRSESAPDLASIVLRAIESRQTIAPAIEGRLRRVGGN